MTDTLNEDEFADEPKRRTFLVNGPNGWTEGFDERTIELLLRMGAIRETHVTSAAGWETTFYDTVGRYPS